MNQAIYYMSWRTWQEHEVHTPWDFWFLKEGSEYRPRSGSQAPTLDRDQMAQVFLSGDPSHIQKLTDQYVNDVKLVSFVTADSVEAAQSQIRTLFPDAEFDKCELIDEHTKQQIIQLFGVTLKKTR